MMVSGKIVAHRPEIATQAPGIRRDVVAIGLSAQRDSLELMADQGADWCFEKPYSLEKLSVAFVRSMDRLGLEPKSVRVLILDDQEGCRTLPALYLRSACGVHAQNILLAENPDHALDTMRRAGFTPDVVISDNDMKSTMAGWEFIRNIRSGCYVTLQ